MRHLKWLVIIVICVLCTPALAVQYFNMTPGVTPISQDIYALHMTIFWICVVIGGLVFIVLIYAMIKHRKSIGHKPAKFHTNTTIEIIWTVIPFTILILMAIPATIVLIRMSDDSKADINIKITGYQWKWKYEYLDYGISFFSVLSTPRAQIENKQKKGKWYLLEVDKPLVLPIHKKIRFLVTSNDVIHSWWVPALGIKRDAIPGFIHESWARIEKPGTYRGQCAELCGINHAYMPVVVIAKTQADFKKWLSEQRQEETAQKDMPLKTLTKAELMTQGEKTYNTYCAVCHKADGKGQPPAFPALQGGKISTGPVQGHIDIVLHGVTGTSMQAFKDQLTPEQIAAVVTYERNQWGNDDKQKYGQYAGGIVQPSDVVGKKGKTSSESTATKPESTEKKPESPQTKTQPLKSETKENLMQEGEKIYNSRCLVCHKTNGEGQPPIFPALKGGKITTGPVQKHIDIVINGVPGTTMVAFKNQLSPREIAAVITYERNKWGNDDKAKYGQDAGGLVQPADIANKEKSND